MKKIIHKVFTTFPWLLQFLKYGIIGTFTALMDILVFSGLRAMNTPLYTAHFIGTNVGILLSFFINVHVNFKVKDHLLKRGFYFFLVGYLGMLISAGFLHLGIEILIFKEFSVKIVSVIIVACIQFVLNKQIAFKKTNS